MIILENASKDKINSIIDALQARGVSIGSYHPNECYFIVMDRRMVDVSIKALSALSWKDEGIAKSCAALKEYLEESIIEGDFEIGESKYIDKDIAFDSWQIHYYEYSKKIELDATATPMIKHICDKMNIGYKDVAVTTQLVQFYEFNALEIATREYLFSTKNNDEKAIVFDLLYLLCRSKKYQGVDAPYDFFIYLIDALRSNQISTRDFQNKALYVLDEFNIKKWGRGFVDDLVKIIKSFTGDKKIVLDKIHFMLYPQDITLPSEGEQD